MNGLSMATDSAARYDRRISADWAKDGRSLALAWILTMGMGSPLGATELVDAKRIGSLPSPVREASGLAVSRRDPGLFWVHSDSGGEPVLWAIAADGALRGSLRIEGVANVDWEDAASFTLDGRSWLLVADTGDNGSRRSDCALLVVAEPDPAELDPNRESRVALAWRIPVVYPDGPRDCEAVAVDSVAGKVYLLAKRVKPHGIYTLPLRPVAAGVKAPEAERVGEMSALPPAPAERRLLPIPAGAFRAQPTGLDIAADGSAAVVTTYGEVLVYPKSGDETWGEALARPGRVVGSHGLDQAEAVAFGADGRTIHVTGEGAGAPLLRYRGDR